MKTLVYGAGTLGCLYAHRLFQAGHDVTILARGSQLAFIRENGIVLVDGWTGEQQTSMVPVVDGLSSKDTYDLVIVLMRKNCIQPVLKVLEKAQEVGTVLFMGNNTLGFDDYVDVLPADKILFGFPGAGGFRKDGVVHFVDAEKEGGNRLPVTIGEMDGKIRQRTRTIISLFESSGIPVDISADIDGWLRYHVAMVSPIAGALHKHACDNYALAGDRDALRLLVGAWKEGGDVLAALGCARRQPFKYNLFYWMPEWLTAFVFSKILNSRFAEIAFAQHARAAPDEMRELAAEFHELAGRTKLATPCIDLLRGYLV